MNYVLVCALIITGLAADPAQAQQMWRIVPKIVVISPTGDSRLPAVDEAVAFWNRTFTELGSGFRLGAVTRMVRPIPEEALQQLSTSVLGGRGNIASFPPALSDLPGVRSDEPRMFPLRSDEKVFVLSMYPSQWKSQSR